MAKENSNKPERANEEIREEYKGLDCANVLMFNMNLFKNLFTKKSQKKDQRPEQDKFQSMMFLDFEILEQDSANCRTLFENYFNLDACIMELGKLSIYSEQDWLRVIQSKEISKMKTRDLYASLILSPDKSFFNMYQAKKKTKIDQLKILHQNFHYQSQVHTSNSSVDIDKDVVRTYANNTYFKQRKGVEVLRRILFAYSNLDKEIGYCQGMNNIVANLLILMDYSQNDDEIKKSKYIVLDPYLQQNVFWIFVHIMYQRNWRNVFLLKNIDSLEETLFLKIRQHYPQLLKHFNSKSIDFKMAFIHHYITLMLYDTPKNLAAKIVDMFLLLGQNAIHSIILKTLQISRKQILAIEDEAELVSYLRVGMIERLALELQNEKREEFKKSCINFVDIKDIQ